MSDIFKQVLKILDSNGYTHLDESSLSTIIRKINRPDVSAISIFSPFRKEHSQEQNESSYQEVKQEITDNGWGYIQLEGGWKEKEGIVKEKSFFIEVPLTQEQSLWKFSMKKCQQYNQDGFIFYSNVKPFGVYSKRGHTIFTFKGSTEGTFKHKISFSDVEEMYSSLRFGSHAGRKFIFESLEQPDASTSIGALIRKNWMNE